jgi:hypothetical protein
MKYIKTILLNKCASCTQSNVFTNSLFSLKNPFSMNKECTTCKFNYEPEPGFYFGSMYVAYALSSFYCLSFCFLSVFYFDFSIGKTSILLITTMLIIFIIIFRMSRLIWLSIYEYYKMR